MRTQVNLLLSLMLIILLGLTSISQAASISGTVTNGTSKTGRIYITAKPVDYGGDWSYGVSIPAAGSYTINGLPTTCNNSQPCQYQVQAYADVQGNGVRHANDPAASYQTTVQVDSSSINLSLAVPNPIIAPQANEIIAYQGNGGNTVLWKPYESDNGLPIADKYVISWNDSATDSGASSKEIRSGHDTYMYFHNGGTAGLYYKVTAYAGTTAAATQWVQVTPRTGGVTVSGTVSLAGVSDAKPLAVVLMQEIPNGYPLFYSAVIPSASNGSNTYNITNVPQGTYRFHAFFDVDQDGAYSPGDLTFEPGQYASPEVIVGSSDVSGPANITITQRNAFSFIQTTQGVGASTWKGLGFTIEGQAKQPVNVTITGPGLQDNTPVGIQDDKTEFRVWPALTTSPTTGNSYRFILAFADGTSETQDVVVGTFLDSYATPQGPIGTVTYTNGIPTFSWQAPSTPPTPYSYHLWLYGSDVSWNTDDDIPATQTSILYNADGNASKQQLSPNTNYAWSIVVMDRYGNQAAYQTSFTMTSSSSTISMTGSTFTPAGPSPLPGVTITQEGTANTTTSGVDGSFTLNNLPASTPFRLVMTSPGLVPVYTQYFNSATNLNLSNTPYYFLTQSNLGLTTGKGAIIATFVDSSNGQALSGVTATAAGYTVQYLKSDVGSWDGTATDASGIIKILNVTPNTDVTITPSKTGYTFSPQTFSVPADSVLEAGIFGSAAPTAISFTGRTVIAVVGTALSNVTVTQVDPNNNNTSTGNSTTSGSDGIFTLGNLPLSTQFRLLMTHPSGSYMPVYSQRFSSSANINNSSYPYFLVPVGSITTLQSGKGVIFARLIDSSNGSLLSGATATATAGYTVQYRNVTVGDWSGTATDSSGLVRIVNVPPNTNITLAPVKSGYTFNGSPYSLAVFAADSVSEINLYATPATTYTLGLQRSGSGSGTIQVQINGLTAQPCSNTNCSYSGLSSGSSITLTAVPATGSSFGGWSSCGSSTSVCSFTLTGDTLGVTATFSLQPFKVEGLTTYYDTLLNAFSSATTGQKIRGQKSYEAPATAFNRSISTDQITLKGGYDNSFSDTRATTDFSTIGPLTIQNGTLTVDQVIVK